MLRNFALLQTLLRLQEQSGVKMVKTATIYT